MKKYITILIVTFTAISCGKIREARTSLNDIETFINERPDSALMLLDSFTPSLLEYKSLWAHHSLLHAQAKDKCYIDETNDSLMIQVMNYYEDKRDKDKLFKAYYYLGRIQYNAGDYTASMLSYTKAEQMIDKIDDDFIKGLLYAQLGMLHQKYYDYTKALESYESSYKFYQSNGAISHMWYAKYNIGYVYREMKQYERAEDLLKSVMSWSYDNNQYHLCNAATKCLVNMYDEQDCRKSSNEIVNGKYGSLFFDSLYIIRAKAFELAMRGDRSSIDIMQRDIWKMSTNFEDTLNNYFYSAKIYKILGQYENAMLNQEKIYHIQDSLLTSSLKYPLLTVKNKYLDSEHKNAHLKIRTTRTIMCCICIFFIIVSILIRIIYRNHIKAKDFEISRYVEVADDLERSLICKRDELEKITKEAGVTNKQLKENTAFISDMFSKQYELLNKLTSTYYETHGCNKDKEAIYKYVSKEIECLSSDKKTIHRLEELVNLHKGNIMKTIRENLPNLTEMEYRLLCYLCVGFSAKAISIFTGDSTNNIYVKKSRIKGEIQKLDANIAEQILSVISSKNDIHL